MKIELVANLQQENQKGYGVNISEDFSSVNCTLFFFGFQMKEVIWCCLLET